MIEILPHINGVINIIAISIILSGYVAIRLGNKALHRKLMLAAVTTAALFLIGYLTHVYYAGHQRFAGTDSARTVFLLILVSHTLLAIIVVPLVLRTVYLALRKRFEEHRRWARITFPIWAYVGITGVMIYWMVNFFRPTA